MRMRGHGSAGRARARGRGRGRGRGGRGQGRGRGAAEVRGGVAARARGDQRGKVTCRGCPRGFQRGRAIPNYVRCKICSDHYHLICVRGGTGGGDDFSCSSCTPVFVAPPAQPSHQDELLLQEDGENVPEGSYLRDWDMFVAQMTSLGFNMPNGPPTPADGNCGVHGNKVFLT